VAGDSLAARGVVSAPESEPSLFSPNEEPRLRILRCIRPEDGAGDGIDSKGEPPEIQSIYNKLYCSLMYLTSQKYKDVYIDEGNVPETRVSMLKKRAAILTFS